MREFKSSPIFTKDITGRSVVGICAVFGVVDDAGDRIHAGAFARTIAESNGRVRAKHLWGHDFSKPPIASIKKLQEVSRDALPSQVIAYAPEATGGLEVTRDYYAGVELAEHVLKAVLAGDISEMSFGFDAIKFDFTTVGEGMAETRVRELREVRLYDTSDVLWGMNNATAADVSAKAGLPLELIAQNLASLVRDIKAGARNATSDLKLINAIHRAAISLGCDECKGLIEDGKAGTAPSSIPLSQLGSQITQLEIDAI